MDAYEGLGRVMCYNQITYSGDRSSATVEAKCRQHNSVTSLQYNWNNEGYGDSATYEAGSDFQDALSLSVKAIDGDSNEFTITMEALNFIWQGETINQDAAYQGGQKGAIVEMFGWPHEDVKQECEYLA